jgi:hypothetical protein
MGVTGCNYGVHPFQFEALPLRDGLHMHVCPQCGAAYSHPGDGPCRGCRPAETTETS